MYRPDIRRLLEVEEAAETISRGEVVAFPTETSYGLGARFDAPRALKRIFEIKQRPADKPLLLLISRREHIFLLVRECSPTAERLMERFWPGPLTLLLPALPDLDAALTGATGKVGIRISSHDTAKALVEATGVPITATSANLTGLPPALSPEEVARQLADTGLKWILDGGELVPSPPSTILDCSQEPPILVRQGRIAWREIEQVIGEGGR